MSRENECENVNRKNLTDEPVCKLMTEAVFSKGETIHSISAFTGRGGIIESGKAHISSFDKDGSENVLEILNEGDSFSEYYIYPQDDVEHIVVADTDCKVIFLNIKKFLAGCSSDCVYHEFFLRKLFIYSTHHSQMQEMHLDILTKRTTREKLLTYFKMQKMYLPTTTEFTLPISLSDLANYICVDRSAMMREIKKMNEDGVIRSNGRKVVLLRE